MSKKFSQRNQGRRAQKEIAAAAAVLGVDPRAVQVLYSAYYDLDVEDSVWPDNRIEPPKDLAALAKEAGVLHDVVEMSHDEIIASVIAARDRLDRREVANAFIVGLERSLHDLDCPLASYARHRHVAAHPFAASQGRHGRCLHCDLEATQRFDRDRENLVRIRLRCGGGPPDLTTAMIDFEELARLSPITPTAEQGQNFRELLDAIRALPDKARTGELVKATSGKIKGDKYRRQKLLETLGWCGVLKPAVLDWTSDMPMPEQDLSKLGVRVNWEMQFPVHGWCGADGVNEEAVAFWFSGFEGASRPRVGHLATTHEKAKTKQA